MSANGCVVLVPVYGSPVPECDDALRELERRGYAVRRVRGHAAIDAARNQMATDALARGFDELMWIDSDVIFDPADVDRLRAHALPLVCGIYPKKGRRQLASVFLPGTRSIQFGTGGGLVEILYSGFGFTLTRRAVFDAVRQQFALPECNTRFGATLVPYFQPMVVPDGPGATRYLAEDMAFCHRAREAGIVMVADTSIRLWHVGSYKYGWEDAGSDPTRYTDYTFHLGDSE